MLHLHVWGSAFGLPSIDPECLAIITYLHSSLPSSAWRLIPSNDPSASPSNLLPALNHDGVWTSGYLPIVDYLTSKSLCKDLDEALDAAQQADSVAYTAYLGAHAAPLVDLSLYVSAANWSATTRPAYSSLLSFPLTWTVPILIRAEAVKRAEHLGLAELDSDFDPNGGLHLTAGRDALPETFRRHLPAARTKRTVLEEMTPEQATAIRLLGLTADCLSVLDGLLARDDGEPENERRLRFFAGTPVSSLDCLAFAYLALMQKPPVPRSFLRDWLESKSPRLSEFVDDMMTTCVTARGDLPWASPPDQTTLVGFGGRVLDSVVRHVPGVGDHYAAEMRRRAEENRKGLDPRALMLVMGAVLTGLATGYGFYMYRAMQPFGAPAQVWQPRRLRSRLGELGQLVSLLSSAMGPPHQPAPSGFAGGHRTATDGRLVEVDSEVD